MHINLRMYFLTLTKRHGENKDNPRNQHNNGMTYIKTCEFATAKKKKKTKNDEAREYINLIHRICFLNIGMNNMFKLC